jgi:hypothetical protein
MNVFVPELVYDEGYNYYNYLSGHKSDTNFCFGFVGVEQDQSYFYNTEHRTVNDCVHGKLVNAAGISQYCCNMQMPYGRYVDAEGHSATRMWVAKPGRTYLIILSANVHWKGDTYYQRWHTLDLYMFRPVDLQRMEETHQQCDFNVNFDGGVLVDVTSNTLGRFGEAAAYAMASKEFLWGNEKVIPENGTWSGLVYQALRPLLHLVPKDVTGSIYRPWKVSGGHEILTDPVEIRKRFLFDEPELIVDGMDPLLVSLTAQSYAQYWRCWLRAHAFLDACEHIPKMSDNSISNVIEIVQFIVNLVVHHRIDIPDSLGSAWLAYRYQFKTTELDTREAINFVHRHMDLKGKIRNIKCYGMSSKLFDDGTEVTCRCTFTVSQRELAYVDKIWEGLYTYGLEPNFYVIWDMIPYSFIVDWFIPIGDMLSVVDASRHYNSDTYDFKDICYTLKYTVNKDGITTSHFSRWGEGSTPPELHAYYWFDREEGPSNTTIRNRVLDALSLIAGH